MVPNAFWMSILKSHTRNLGQGVAWGRVSGPVCSGRHGYVPGAAQASFAAYSLTTTFAP